MQKTVYSNVNLLKWNLTDIKGFSECRSVEIRIEKQKSDPA